MFPVPISQVALMNGSAQALFDDGSFLLDTPKRGHGGTRAGSPMFPTRARLSHVDCPDHLEGVCQRPSCPFAHNTKRRREDEVEDEVEAVPAPKKKAVAGPTSRQGNPELKTLLSALSAGPRNAYAGRKEAAPTQAASTVATAPPPPSTTVTTRTPALTPPSTTASSSLLVAPSIARTSHPGSSPIPLASRQSSLSTLFTTFQTLYSALVPPRHQPRAKGVTEAKDQRVLLLLRRLVHHLASKDALASENKVFKNSNVNFLAYKNSIRTSLVGLSKRQKADSQAEEKGERQCICMLGMQVAQMAVGLESVLEKEQVTEADKQQRIEEAIIKMLSESTLMGTSEEVEHKKKEEEKRSKGRLDISRLKAADLLTDQATLAMVGYPIPADWKEGDGSLQAAIEKSWGEGGRQPTLEGMVKTCDRCGTSFTVAKIDSGNAHEQEACTYHWGKRRYVREANVAKGPRLPRWTCCDALDEATTYSSNSLSQIAASAGIVDSTQGSASPSRGCSMGPHVFKEESSDLLHQREGFLSTEEICGRDGKGDEQTHEVLAFDCELIYTTAGMSLARLTVLDQAGKVIMDQHVKPKAAILDYNTR